MGKATYKASTDLHTGLANSRRGEDGCRGRPLAIQGRWSKRENRQRQFKAEHIEGCSRASTYTEEAEPADLKGR